MKPLKVALICKNENSTRRDNRAMGYWSYDIPEFTWDHFTPGKNFTIDLDDLKADGYDLVFHEDYPYGNYIGDSIPVVFLSIDSTLSNEHFKVRYNQAVQSDLILVDHDNTKRFKHSNDLNVIQFPYCVNDKIFFRYEMEDSRDNDIAYHCSSSAHAGIEQRKHIRQLLHDLSVKHNWNYRSGVLPLDQYAESFRTSKIVVNQSRTPLNRPHRIFDAMACGAMVLTSPLPRLEADKFQYEMPYEEFHDDIELEEKLCYMLENSDISRIIANKDYNIIIQNHTWSIRAKQLREIINKEFGL